MFVSLLRSWRSTQSLSAIVPVTRQFKNNSHILAKELFPLQGCQTAEIHCENQPPEYAVSYTQQFRQNSIDVRGPEVVYFWDKLRKCFGSNKGEKKKKGKKAKKQSCKKKKCGKQKDSCLKKKDSCEKPDEKKELCKTEAKKADGDKKEVKQDPCKKKEEKKEDPCKKKEEKKKEDPCKKKEEKKKEDPCKKKEEKKEDPCKKKEEKKDDPCAPCNKKEDPCKKKEEKKEDPCKKKEDPCKKKEDPCKKKDPCAKCIPDSLNSHESVVLFTRTDAFGKKEEERCSKPCKDPCAEGACDVLPGQNEPCSTGTSWKIKVRPCRQASPCQSKKAAPPSGPCIIEKVDIVEQKLEPDDNCGLTKHPCGKKVCPNRCDVKRKTKFSDLQEDPQVAIKNLLDVLGYQTRAFQSMSILNFAYARGPVPPNRAPDPRQPATGQRVPANEPPPAQKYSEKVAGLLEKLKGLWQGQGAANSPVEANQAVKSDKQSHPGRPSSGRRLFGIIGSEIATTERDESQTISAEASLESLSAEGDSHVLFMTDDFENCEDSIPPCPTEPEGLPCPAIPEDCIKTTDDIWSDIDANWGYEKFPWRSNIVKDERLDEVSKGPDDPYANNKL